MTRFLLDTNMLLGFIREAPWALRARTEYDLADQQTIIFTSIVCHGEILALAEKRGWGSRRRDRLEEVLAAIPTIDIGSPGILAAYALIDAWTHGKDVASPRNHPPPKPAVPMSKNDLWIAATAHVGQAVLLSTDNDFAHLDKIWFDFKKVDTDL